MKQFRSGRWVKLQGDKVIGLATDEEADAWIRANLLDQAQPEPGPETTPAALANSPPLPLFALDRKDSGDNGDGAQPELLQKMSQQFRGNDTDIFRNFEPEFLRDFSEQFRGNDSENFRNFEPTPADDPDLPEPVTVATDAHQAEPAPTSTTDNGFWLWVDPRREPGYNPAAFDQAAFLTRAVGLFRTKEQWKGQPPNAVRAHPDQAANGLQAAAQGLGLHVVSDPLVTAGTYRLGLVNQKGGGGELV